MDGIKQISKQDALDAIALSSFAFQLDWSEEYIAKRAAELVPDEHWGYYEKGELAAKLRIIPLSSLFYGRAFKMGGIASVATWPQYRRKGMVAKLLTHALKVMKDNGQTVSMLHPFSYAFYRKYGWEMNTEYKRYTLGSHLLRPISDEGGTMERLKNPKEEWPLLNELYMKHAVQYNGMLYRDEAGWKHVVADEKRMAYVFYNEEKKLEGYLIYHIESQELRVKEIIFISEAARRKMWNFLCSHDSMVGKVTIVVARDDQLPFLLHEPTIQQEIVPYSMARIVDVKGFMEQVPFLPSSFGEEREVRKFTISIKDKQADWNDGVFEVVIDEAGKATVRKVSGESDVDSECGAQGGNRDRVNEDGKADVSDVSDVSCDIQTFSAIMTGYQRPLDAYRYNRLFGDRQKIKLWDDALSQRHVHLLDFF